VSPPPLLRVEALHSGLKPAEKKELLSRFQRRDVTKPNSIDVLITVRACTPRASSGCASTLHPWAKETG
jgi:hypothetical protein